MGRRIDLNADMGESFGDWVMGDDAGLLKIVTSANIACGAHAGDPDVMARTMAAAVKAGVGLGAHPGFADLQGFGRRRLTLTPASLGNLIRYQTGAAQAMARGAGGRLRHFKLHGALSNMAAEDAALARTCYRAALELQDDLVLLVQPATAMEQAARDLGAAWAGEIFADRAYLPDGSLMPRDRPGAVIHDPAQAAARIAAMVAKGAILPETGAALPTRIDTVCLHGDTPKALQIARAVRRALTDMGCEVRPL